MKLASFDIFNALQLAAIILLPLGIYAAFSHEGIAEGGYGELLGSAGFLRILGEVSFIKIISLATIVISALLLYLSLSKLSKERALAFLVTVLFIFSPIVTFNIAASLSFSVVLSLFLFSLSLTILAFAETEKWHRNLAALPVAIALFLLWPTINLTALSVNGALAAIGLVGFLFPLSFIFLAFEELRKKGNVLPFVAGVITVPFFPSFSLIALSFCTLNGMGYLLKNRDKLEGWLYLSFFIVLYLGITVSSAITQLILGAAALAGFMYFLFSLQIILPKTASVAFVFMTILLASSTTLMRLEKDAAPTPSAELINMFKSAKELEGNVGIIEFPNAFKFYTGKEATFVAQDKLISNESLDAAYLVLSTDSLYRVFENRSVALKFLGMARMEKVDYAVFGNKAYLLYAAVSSSPEHSILAEPQPTLIDLKSNYKKGVPFSKLRLFNPSLSSLDSNNILINIEPITDTTLYNILIKCDVVSETNTTRLFKVC